MRHPDKKFQLQSFDSLRISRSLAEQGSTLVPALSPLLLQNVAEEYADGRVKVYRNPNERVVRTQRIDAELEDGKVSFERYTTESGLIVLPPGLSAVRVLPKSGRDDALVVLENRVAVKKSYSFEDRTGRKVGFAFGENVEMAIIQDLGIEDPKIAELAGRTYVSPEIARWLRMRLVLNW